MVGQAVGPPVEFRVGEAARPCDHGFGDADLRRDALEQVRQIQLHRRPSPGPAKGLPALPRRRASLSIPGDGPGHRRGGPPRWGGTPMGEVARDASHSDSRRVTAVERAGVALHRRTPAGPEPRREWIPPPPGTGAGHTRRTPHPPLRRARASSAARCPSRSPPPTSRWASLPRWPSTRHSWPWPWLPTGFPSPATSRGWPTNWPRPPRTTPTGVGSPTPGPTTGHRHPSVPPT